MYSTFLRASPVQSIPRKSVNNQFFCCLLDQSLSPCEFREIHKQNPGDFHGSPFVSVLLRSGNALQESVLRQANIEGLSRFRAPTVIYHIWWIQASIMASLDRHFLIRWKMASFSTLAFDVALINILVDLIFTRIFFNVSFTIGSFFVF